MAARLTPGQQAVAAIVAAEVLERGECALPVGAIAAKAGVCVAWTQRAVAELVALGWAGKELRPRRGAKNLTNRVTILSAEWLAWISKRPRSMRQAKAGGVDRVYSGRPDQNPILNSNEPAGANHLRKAGGAPPRAARTSSAEGWR